MARRPETNVPIEVFINEHTVKDTCLDPITNKSTNEGLQTPVPNHGHRRIFPGEGDITEKKGVGVNCDDLIFFLSKLISNLLISEVGGRTDTP